MSAQPDPYVLPANLPAPVDDGAADHLEGAVVPPLSLPSTSGARDQPGRGSARRRSSSYCYPRTGRPGEPLPPGWDEIPGARGCTPQSCAFRDHFAELRALGAAVLGLSAQPLDDQVELAERVGLPYPVLSDPDLRLADALGLPTFEVAGMRLYRRLTFDRPPRRASSRSSIRSSRRTATHPTSSPGSLRTRGELASRLLLRPRLSVRVPRGGAGQLAVRRGGGRTSRMAPGAARGPVQALRPRLVVERARPGFGDRGGRAPRGLLRPAPAPLAGPVPRQHPGRDARGRLREGGRPRGRVLAGGVPPGVRGRTRSHRSGQRGAGGRRRRAPPARRDSRRGTRLRQAGAARGDRRGR